MKKSAQFVINVLTAVVIINVAALVFSKDAKAATGPLHSCETGTSCVIGEFLYDDSYAPINDGNCTLTSRKPDGSLYLNAIEMTDPDPLILDGWYSHEFTAPSTLGIYRSQICCTSGSEYLCLDKSFNVAAPLLSTSNIANTVWDAPRSAHTASGTFGEAMQNIIPATADIAQATWAYSSRSLSTFGSLVADVWNNSGRSLTGFGTLISDVWNSTTRTLTGASLGSGSLATKADVDTKVDAKTQELKTDISNLKKVSQQTNLLLEQIVNKPVIETAVEEVPDLQAKLKSTEAIANQLFISIQYAQSKAGLANLQWDSFEDNEVLDLTQELTTGFGGENDSSSASSVYGHISFLNESWDWNFVETIKNQVKAVKVILASIQSEVESSGRSGNIHSKMKTLVGFLDQLGNSIGDVSNKPSQNTLFGKLKETKLLADQLEGRSEEAGKLLDSWDSYQSSEKLEKVRDLSKKVVTINRIPNINRVLLSTTYASEKELKNQGLFVLGIINANKKLLAGKTGSTLISTWLETGSMVFKSLVSNPSTIISQNATVKYYLPPEIKETDIIETDEGLTVKYDTEKNQYYVSGEFYLAPSETKTVSVRTQDIWVINQEKIKSLRKQAEDLSKPLDKTSYFGQGVTIKSDIDVSLDKVLMLIKSNASPEAKIRAWREAEIEMKAVEEKIGKLKELVTQAGSVGTLFGFVGGTQALAVWGLILILAVGFVFLSLYMRILIKKEETAKKPATEKKKLPESHDAENSSFKLVTKPRNSLRFAMILLGFGIGFGLTLGIILGKGITFAMNPTSKSSVEKVPVEKIPEAKVLGDEKINPVSKQEEIPTIQIVVPPGASVNIRKTPSVSSAVITRISRTAQFPLLDEENGWVKIGIEEEKEEITYNEGWVSAEFAKEE